MGPTALPWDAAHIEAASALHLKPPNFQPSYGTAGQACGLMITASHNPEPDNGVKIVEPDGGMLVSGWEAPATAIACASSDEQVAQLVGRLLVADGVRADGAAAQPCVVLGCDTRPSGPKLVAAARNGVAAMGAQLVDLGQVSTPQLHFHVAALNAKLHAAPHPAIQAPSADSDTISLDLYFATLLGGFDDFLQGLGDVQGTAPTAPGTGPGQERGAPLYVDCANGVGAAQLRRAGQQLAAAGLGLTFTLINTGGNEGSHCGLNHTCGADYVQKELVAPHGFDDVPDGARCCSIDGDADRLVYFVPGSRPASGAVCARPVALLDGDKIAALAASLVQDLIAGLPADIAASVRVGVVQTAYANGASTRYLQSSLGLQVVCTKTGVKHLHPAAHAFDVGIYFEANGHGTVLFSAALLARLQQCSEECAAARQLLALARAVNQAVGDALSCILLVEAALSHHGWGITRWQALYRDLPSRQRKLVVKDRGAVVSKDAAERRVCAPDGLQEAIDALVQSSGDAQARAFVRASGTEDAVRVYAEASTQAAADKLALHVAQAVHDLAGGVGPRPEV